MTTKFWLRSPRSTTMRSSSRHRAGRPYLERRKIRSATRVNSVPYRAGADGGVRAEFDHGHAHQLHNAQNGTMRR